VAHEPLHVVDDAVDVLHLFLGGVGVVEPQVALTAVPGRQTEVEDEGLAVADVEIAVGFRRKAGDDLAAILPLLEVLLDDVGDEIVRVQLPALGFTEVGHGGPPWKKIRPFYRETRRRDRR